MEYRDQPVRQAVSDVGVIEPRDFVAIDVPYPPSPAHIGFQGREPAGGHLPAPGGPAVVKEIDMQLGEANLDPVADRSVAQQRHVEALAVEGHQSLDSRE